MTERADADKISVRVSKDEHLIEVTLSGRPRAASIVAMLVELNRLVAEDPTLRVLIDEEHLGPSFVGPGDIGRFVDAWKNGSALRATRIAVFTSNIAMYGLNRMFQGLANAEDRVSVFHKRADALAWLGDGLAR